MRETKECPVCHGEAVLIDAGYNEEQECSYRRFECERGHPHRELFNGDDEEEGEASVDNGAGPSTGNLETVRRLNRFLDRLGVSP